MTARGIDRPEIEVIDGGALTIVQDEGRWGYASLGVPVCGPMDPFAFSAANVLAGNDPGAAALEMTAVGPTLAVGRDCFIAVTGGDLALTLDGRAADGWRAHFAARGTRIAFAGRRLGARGYLGVSGGIAVAPWLGSRSTYIRGGVGGFAGRALRTGDRLPLGDEREIVRVPLRGLAEDARPHYGPAPTLRVILGPHRDRFTPQGVETFLESEYRVSEQSDRMGYRLDGPTIALRGSADISSCGIPLGGIQVPGNGKPILLMADHQTAGGYPLIGGVIQADIPLAAQCLPGDTVRFQAVSLAEARESLRSLYEALREIDSVAAVGAPG
jgi:biotin-dependent carboxylase-like uncharacterized protein